MKQMKKYIMGLAFTSLLLPTLSMAEHIWVGLYSKETPYTK